MRFKHFKHLLEASSQDLTALKTAIASKIKDLPSDDATIKTLKEIEELLRDVNAGGRMGLIGNELKAIQDPAVQASHKALARYILSIDSTPEQRRELFDLWKNDKLIKLDVLFSGKHVSFEDVFTSYSETKNPLIKELVDELVNVATLGHGKGEFCLNVLSKSINKPKDGKGDLIANINGKTTQVEVKTASLEVVTDPETGKDKRVTSSARFGDQEVRPAAGWDAAARELNELIRTKFKINVPTSGINLANVIKLYSEASDVEKPILLDQIIKVITLIFGETEGGRPEYIKELKSNINDISNAIKSNNIENAKQSYSQATFNYYMSKKSDDGVLYIDLPNNKFVWYKSVNDLKKSKLRFHSDTIYITGVKDPGRTAYPQIYIQPTSFGRDTASKKLTSISKDKKFIKTASPEELRKKFLQWASDLAILRNVNDQNVVVSITNSLFDLFKQGIPTSSIIDELERLHPEIDPTKK